MKLTVIVVVLALAVGIECYAPSLTYTAVSGPALIAAAPAWGYASHAHHAAPVWGHGSWAPAASYAHHASVAPAAIAIAPAAHAAIIAPAAHHAAIIAPAAHATWGHEGSYVAKTRGAVHVAPLAGHAHSATSINLQPAPGTI